MPKWLKAAAQKVVNEYRGNAENVWCDCHTAAEAIARLDDFKGIGLKKAHMAAASLREWHVFGGFEAINMAVDVHVRRVWKRLGLVKKGEVREIHAVAAAMRPAYPGALDLPTWTIGRDWCNAARPDCEGLAAGKSCPLEKCCSHRRSHR
jgi:endonuclease III